MSLHGLSRASKHARDVDAPSAVEVAEVQAADHLVGDEQRVRIDQNANGFIKVEFQILELVLECLVVPWARNLVLGAESLRGDCPSAGLADTFPKQCWR